MKKALPEIKLFSHYNVIVISVFIVIVFFFIAVAIYRYQFELDLHHQNSLTKLIEQSEILDNSLSSGDRALRGLKRYAEYTLQNPDTISSNKPKLVQDEESFRSLYPSYIESAAGKAFTSSITGRGNINQLNEPIWQELKMAHALTPAFVTADENVEDATWFYYLSENRFVSIYPWISHKKWQYSNGLSESVYFNKVRQDILAGEAVSWSSPYNDTAGKGMMASVGAGVFIGSQLKGLLILDMNLGQLKDKLPAIERTHHGYVLMNGYGQVVFHKGGELNEVKNDQLWQDVVPSSLSQLSQRQVVNMPASFRYGGWFIQKTKLQGNGWYLIRYQPYSDFTSPLLNEFLSLFVLFFVGLVIFLALIFVITRHAFVKPTTQFINHIECCANSMKSNFKPNKGWQMWFELVEVIFSENRRLLLQMREKNTELDARVEEKTQALNQKISQHQRDYVLLRAVINAIPEFIIFNDNEGKLIGCNRSFEQFIHQDEHMLLGQNMAHILPDSLATTLSDFSKLSYEQTQFGYSQTVETLNGTFDVFCTRFYSDAGKSLGSISIIRDVSEQHEVQSELQIAKDQSEQANQAKSQFLANMSHEIRTPINAIKGMMALMEKTDLSTFQRQYLDNAQGASEALLHLIDELLDLSRIEAGKLRLHIKTTDLDGVIDRALQLNSGKAYQKGLTLKVEIDNKVPRFISTDNVRLVQVLANLLHNAIKFTHQGQVMLFVTATARGENNALIRFKVVDTGVGIALDKQGKLFDAFSQADDSMTREYGGSGLGLSICQQIVMALGSKITLKSEFGQGSEFSFVLPVKLAKPKLGQMPILNIATVACPFSTSMIESIVARQWQLYEFTTLEQLSGKSFGSDTVLVIDSDYLSENSDLSLGEVEQQFPEIKLLALCQPITGQVNDEVHKQLEQLKNLPYFLLDKPIYRYSLTKIKRHFLKPHKKRTAPKNTPLRQLSNEEKQVSEHSSEQCLHGYRILLVEDNLVNQMVAKELLYAMGADVVIAENGQVALDITQDEAFDVILMDIQMPVMDGLTATKVLRKREQYKQVPIIAMTAHARNEDKEASLSAGMDLHVAKPVSAAVLRKSLLQVIAPKGTDAYQVVS